MTTFVDLETLMGRVIKLAPSCPEPSIITALRDAARDLCEASKSWTAWVPYVADGLSATIDLEPPDEAAIVKVRRVRFGDRDLEQVMPAWLDERYPRWRDGTESNAPRFVTQLNTDTLTIHPLAAGVLACDLVLKPSATTTKIPAEVASNWGQQIADGALGAILLTPGQTYTNPQLASFHMGRFNATLDTLRTKQPAGQTAASRRTKGRYF